MRFCTPIFVGTAPRESTAKSARHPAAPVGQSSQTRRHHLTPTPVQQLCTYVQSCDQKRSFLLDRARPVFFSTRWKRKWGVHPRWTSPPWREQTLPRPPQRRPYPHSIQIYP